MPSVSAGGWLGCLERFSQLCLWVLCAAEPGTRAGLLPLSLTSGTGLSRSLASHIPRSGGLSSVHHGLCPATPLLPQVMGLGLSSVFALCLGHTSSFCTSVVFASASIGLQTFNHR